jgi:hypothetical protein
MTMKAQACGAPMRSRALLGAVAAVFAAVAGLAAAQSGEKTWRYQPDQINHPTPKFEYSDEGRAVMIKRFPYFPQQDICQFQKYRFVENRRGVLDYPRRSKLKREPDERLSEEQRAILREWGQPDYLRGPYKSTRGDSVVEWAYHPLNHLFQFVDGKMVYEGSLTDQERIAITYGAPRDVMVSVLEPNTRRETWIYHTWLGSYWREKVFSFTNGSLTFRQEQP